MRGRSCLVARDTGDGSLVAEPIPGFDDGAPAAPHAAAQTGAPPAKRYKAFISYSWADKAWGEWAHKALETYGTPKALVGKPAAFGPVPARLTPIFKDREEEAAGAGITASIETAMASSDFLIVVCSPHSAQSKWVNHEIAWYKTHRDPRRVLALVVGGEPGASSMPGREAEECFPKALLYKIGPDLQPTEEKEDVPLAADARKVGDGKRGAKLKLAAAMLGLGLDDLVRRDERRRTIRRRLVTTALALFSVWMTGNTWYAVTQRNEARAQRRLAEQQTDNANASLDYLVSLFEGAIPGAEDPRKITAVTVLERGLAKLDAELRDKPMVRARLMSAIGSAYQGLGDVKGAEQILAEASRGPFASLEDEVSARMHYADALTRLGKFDAANAQNGIAERRIAAEAPRLTRAEIDHLEMQVAHQRGTLSYGQAKYDAAITEYRDAKALCQKTNLCAATRLAEIGSNLSVALSESGNLKEARTELLEVRDIYLREFGPDHLQTMVALHNIAFTDFLAGDYEAALSTMPAVVAAYDELLDDNHPTQAAANVLLGRIYDALGREDEAVASLVKSRDIYEKALGADKIEVGNVSIYLALALSKSGKLDLALASLARAQAILAKNYAPGDPSFGDLEAHRGLALAFAGKKAEGAASCRRGVAQMAKSLSPSDSWLKEVASQCAPVIAAVDG